LLRVFFVGDTDGDEHGTPLAEAQGGGAEQQRPDDDNAAAQAGGDPALDEFDRSAPAVIADCFGGGVNVPWNLLACIAIGVFLMCTRLVLGTEPPLAHADHLIGALVLTVTVTALAEVARPVRFLNLLLGAALMGAPWLFGAGVGPALIVDTLLGLALIVLSLPRGRIGNRYGNVSRYLV
jgi:hypothetical protein